MLVSLVGLALAGDSTLLLTTSANSGRVALAEGDFDGDGLPDIALTSGDGSLESTLTVWLSSTGGTIDIGLAEAVGLVRLLASDRDGDGVDKLIVGAGQTVDSAGVVHVLSGLGASDDGARIANIAVATIAPVSGQSIFGASLAGSDFDGDGFEELVVGAPGLSGAGIYEGSATGEIAASESAGTVSGASGAGYAVGVVDGFIVAGGCVGKELTSTTCPDGGELLWWSASAWNTDQTVDNAVGIEAIDFMVRSIHPLGDGFAAVGHDEAEVFDLSAGTRVELDTETEASAGAVLVDSQGDEALYLRAQDVIARLEPPFADGTALAAAVDTWSIQADQLVVASDWSGDGCPDLLASDATDGSVHVVHGPCPPPDTGDSGDSTPDSGDSTPDSGDSTPDSEDTARDSDTDDSDPEGPIVCEPEFGWSCGGSGVAGGLFLLLGLGLLRRSSTPSGDEQPPR